MNLGDTPRPQAKGLRPSPLPVLQPPARDNSGSGDSGSPPRPDDGRRLPYQPALDGIRGLSVSAVLAYHAGLPWARGGFLGVDAFFVLSGYLITSLLLAERRATGSVDLAAFWTRRARRLLPALFLVLAGVAVYAAIFAEPGELGRIRSDALATLAYAANWWSVFSGQSYFEQFSAPSPLRHAWSLAIEEQWYAFWPLVVVVLLGVRRGSPNALLTACLIMALGSALLMGWLYDPRGDPSRVYYGTDTRAQSLLVGAALAAWLAGRGPVAVTGKSQAALHAVAPACCALVAWAWIATSDSSSFPYQGGFLLLAVAVAFVIATVVTTRGGLLPAILSSSPLRGLGLISYGVYLWHWPIYLVLTPERTGLDGYALFAPRVAVTLLIATASYHLIESPFRRGAARQWRTSWALASAGAAALVVALILATRGGEPGPHVSASAAQPMSSPASPAEGAASAPVRVLVVGDSVAFTMAQGLGRAASESNLSVWNQGKLGCGVLRGDAVLVDGRWLRQSDDCTGWAERWQSYVDAFLPDVVLVLAGAWDIRDREVGGRVLEFGTTEADAFAASELTVAVDVLSSRGAAVMLLTTPYFERRDLGLAAGGPDFDPARIETLNSLYEAAARERTGVATAVDLSAFVASAGGGADSRDILNDGVHFTPEGADLVAAWLAPRITETALLARDLAPEAAPSVVTSAEMPSPRWLELLAHVPDTEEARSGTVMNDYARYRAAFGVPLPPAGAGGAALFDYYRSLLFAADGRPVGLAPAGATGIADSPPRLTENRALFGFTIADVDQDVWTGDGDLEMLRGRFEGADARYVATDDVAGRAGTLDQGHVIAASGGYVYWSATAEGLDAMAAAAAGERASLAEFAEFRLLAQALERMGTYTALFSAGSDSYTAAEIAQRIAGPDAGDESVQDLRAELEQETRLLPYDAFATGAGVDDDGPFTAVILLNPNEERARENASRLCARVAEGTSWIGGEPFRQFVSRVDITADGRLVLATLRSEAYGLWYGLHAAKDALLLHE